MLISFKEDIGMPVNNKIINEQEVLEKVVLTNEQIDSLTSLIYNVGYTPVKGAQASVAGRSCYEPRNGILFVDSKGKAFEYLEICFACHRTEKSSSLFNDGQYCSTKFELLKHFFRSAGLKYGTGEEYPMLSYNEIFKLDTVEAVFALKNMLSKKTDDGKDISSLNEIERSLFFTINSEQIYDGYPGLSGLAMFYLTNSGNYCTQTLASLKTMGAQRTLGVLDASKLQWPGGKIPEARSKRRAILLKLINVVDPVWQKLETGLSDFHDEPSVRIVTHKEDLGQLIFKFATLHREELTD